MAQTEKTMAAVNALLADNTNGDISAQDIRDAFASQMGYGGMILSIPGAPAIMNNVGTTYALVNIFNLITAKSIDVNALGTNVELGATYRVTIGSSGIYHVSFFASFSSSQNNKLVTFAPHINGSIGLVEVDRFVATGADVGAIAMDAVVTYNAGDFVDMRVKIDAGTEDITFLAAGLNLFRVG